MTEVISEATQPDVRPADGRILPSGDESGTAPGDRSFRPDVEGLRAIAVLLVVLYHSDVPGLSGGFVGVDVFFVISGFVITGVLLRERTSTGKTSILSFYGRRCRRIIPAATLVIIAAVMMAYYFLGVGGGSQTAIDGRWAAVFLANFHFIATGTNYLAAEAPPSPLQNFWSLAVEEQFYVVYPTLFLLVAAAKGFTFRIRLAIGLVAVICVSLGYSIVDTHNNSVDAFFSPFTRAWELALGALVAVGTPWLLKVPTRVAAIATWVGFAAILLAAHLYSPQTPYPGGYAIVPVVGTALIIAGGMHAHSLGAEALLRVPPFRWLGKLSYSLYLWHWPILIIAAEYAGKSTLPVKDNLCWDLLALALSVATYRLLENPIRHSVLLRRVRWASIGLGLGLIALTFAVIGVQTNVSGASPVSQAVDVGVPVSASPVPLHEVLASVAASHDIRKVPPTLVRATSDIVENPSSYIGFPSASSGCQPSISQSTVPACIFGDTSSDRTVVLYGDSHAAMWFEALDGIARRAHWKLIVLAKPGCPASLLPIQRTLGAPGDWSACDAWHQFATGRIKASHADLLVISEAGKYLNPNGVPYTTVQWKRSVEELLSRLPAVPKVVIGSPVEQVNDEGPDCLSRHTSHAQACARRPDPGYANFNTAEQQAARAAGARFVNVIPWFCARTCSSVIGHYEVYVWSDHVTLGYSIYLEGVLAQALGIQTPKR